MLISSKAKEAVAVTCCMVSILFLIPKEESLTKCIAPNGKMRNALYSTSVLDQSNESSEDDDNRDLTGFQRNNDNNGNDYDDKEVGDYHDNKENEAQLEEDDTDTYDMKLRSYTYSNCPLVMAKFNQFLLSTDGPFTSEADRRINSNLRAEMALDLVNDNKAMDVLLQHSKKEHLIGPLC